MRPVDDLIRLIEEVSGNVIPERERGRLDRLAVTRARVHGLRDVEAYVRMLRRAPESDEWRHLLGLVTIKESYLFRAPQQLRVLRDVILPEMVTRRPERRMRLWSAGCARGEEAVTLAMILAEMPALAGWDWSILATDVDRDALDDARRGVYGLRAVAQVPEDLRRRYLTEIAPDRFQVDRSLLRRIELRHLNLTQLPLPLAQGTFDVVLLRNVLIYFGAAVQERVAAAVAAVLRSDGYLLLGPSESLFHVSTALEPIDLGDCFCYRCPVPGQHVLPPASRVPLPASPAAADETSHQRSAAPLSPADGAVDQSVLPAASDEVVEALVADRLDVALLEATSRCSRSPGDPMARALLGLARELMGDDAGAREAYRAALYLDPSLFQIHFLLATQSRQQGTTAEARRHLRLALDGALSPGAREVSASNRLGLPARRQVEQACRRALSELET